MRHKGVSGSAFFFNKPATGKKHQNSKNYGDKIVRFQNGSNKVALELRVGQFWSEITRMISDQIALHSVQLPL